MYIYKYTYMSLVECSNVYITKSGFSTDENHFDTDRFEIFQLIHLTKGVSLNA